MQRTITIASPVLFFQHLTSLGYLCIIIKVCIRINASNQMKVCPPGLHLTLGIFYRLFKLPEDACHELDLAAKFRDDQAGGTFDRYLSAVRQQNTLRESTERLKAQVEGMEQLVTAISIALPAASSQPAYSHLCCELQHRRQRLKSLVKQTFKYIHITIQKHRKTKSKS